MDINKLKQAKRERLHKKIRSKIGSGTATTPRLSVFRSNKSMYVQLIDDEKAHTIVSAHTKEIKTKGDKSTIAFELGKLIAKKAQENKISTILFDRGPYRYHGRVRKVAEGAREG